MNEEEGKRKKTERELIKQLKIEGENTNALLPLKRCKYR